MKRKSCWGVSVQTSEGIKYLEPEEIKKLFKEEVLCPGIIPRDDGFDRRVRSCPKCGLQTTDQFGRPIVLGYVCSNIDCPTFAHTVCSTSLS